MLDAKQNDQKSTSGIRFYNTLTRTKEDFTPKENGKVGMYVCGITPYDYSHIGHARVAVVFDTLFRFLKSQGNEVTYVRNFTDIDDKIINRAAEEGVEPKELSEKVIGWFNEEMLALNAQVPTEEPKVSTTMPEIIELIKTLVEKEYAYVAPSGDVIYDISKFANYGKLVNRDIEGQKAGARVDVNDEKRNPEDFLLWKSAKAEEPESVKFESPWGKGRPGWHIECSAMSKKYLGENFDIHGGGEDLQFPHHSCEVAQSEAANFDLVDGKPSKGQQYVNYWLHNGFITVNGTKMSKSLGNFTTIRDVLKDFGGKYSGEAMRLFLLNTHYRKPVDYSDMALQAAEKALNSLYMSLEKAKVLPFGEVSIAKLEAFSANLADDMNTAKALSHIFELDKAFNIALLQEKDEAKAASLIATIKSMANELGILQYNPQEYLKGTLWKTEGLAENEIETFINQRIEAKANKDFALADKIRNDLTAQGIILEDSPNGTTWRRK